MTEPRPVDGALWRLAALLGATGVVAGALGAHALTETLGSSMGSYLTAVRYQLFGALALLAIAMVAPGRPRARTAGWLIGVGTVLFSGSIYGLVFGGPRILGPVTPLGGVLIIGGWCLLAFAAGPASTESPS